MQPTTPSDSDLAEELEAATPVHTTDADCEPHLANDECRVCHVWHGDPCPMCGGRGYHAETCQKVRS